MRRTTIPKHKSIMLQYLNPITFKEAQQCLSKFEIKTIVIEKNRIHIEFKSRQFINSWCDYQIGNEKLDSYFIYG